MKFKIHTPSVRILKEPQVILGNNVKTPDPKMGLKLFGTLRERSDEIRIKVGIIGDSESIEAADEFFNSTKTEIPGLKQTMLHVGFPGLDNDSKLNVSLELNQNLNAEINQTELENISKKKIISDRIKETVKIVENKIRSIMVREPNPDIIIFAVPQRVYEKCVTIQTGKKRKSVKRSSFEIKTNRRRRENTPLNRWVGGEEESESFEVTSLRRYLKGECMKYDIPIQIILPTTLDPDNETTQDPATKIWNLIVGLIYKSNHVPWKVEDLDPKTCYMGVAFYKDSKQDVPWMRTALAQVFSFNAEGLVLKGAQVPINKDSRSPHLTKSDAEELVKRSVEGYKEQNGQYPKRLVVHKTSRFNPDEMEGFKAVSDKVTEIELIALDSRGIKLIRWGQYPPIRGTMVKLPDKSILLYTHGYVPYLDTYPGFRVPSPLEILEHYGPSTSEKICTEILALTKMNWNNAAFYCKAPITIAFAQRVGDILKETPPSIEPKTKFRYYM